MRRMGLVAALLAALGCSSEKPAKMTPAAEEALKKEAATHREMRNREAQNK